MSSDSHSSARMHSVLPQPYRTLFVIIEPAAIIAALLSLVLDPIAHYQSLAPDAALKTATGQTLHQIMTERMTPQVKALQYYFMGALAFSAVVEPLLLYVAVHKLRDPRDSRTVVQAVLASFAAFDIFHAAAAIAGSGIRALVPMTEKWDAYSGINFYVPMVWLVARIAWFQSTGGKAKEL